MRGPPRDPCAEASAFDWAVPGELEAAVQERNHIGFDLLSGCRLHEQVREVAVVGWEEDVAVEPVSVKQPSGQKEGRSFVAFAKRLGASQPIGQSTFGDDGVIEVRDAREGLADALDIVWFVKPLIGLPDSMVDRQGKSERGMPQWSCR